MSARAKAIAPLAIVIGILSFLWTELALNFTFHWVTVQDELLGEGQFGLPENFHLILPTAFISWGLFFAAGGDNAAFGKVFLACVFGSVAAGAERAESDVDLMVIGAVSLRQLSKLLSGVSAKVGREINPHVFTAEDFVRRKKARDHFVSTVSGAPKLFVIGSEDELEAISLPARTV